MNDNNTTANLFSIDVEAHLKKAASHTFGSSSHYPVELVRAALRRGAGEIDIQVKRTCIQLTDNGLGLDSESINTLCCLLDSRQSPAMKEAAVQMLQTRDYFGLLAIFAPAPGKIIVENVSGLEKIRIVFEKGNLTKFNTCDLKMGTRVTLFRGIGRSPSLEKHILKAYCRSAQMDIRLNNRIISRGPLLEVTQLLASLHISNSKYISHGVIGIPRTGDICRLWLLDQGIPYRYIAFPRCKGFIFDAAVEYAGINTAIPDGEVTPGFLDHLAEYAFQLYQWMCENHGAASSTVQTRMEELIFDHHRFMCSQSPSQRKISKSLLDHFAPFKTLGNSTALTLPEIKKKYLKAAVFAVPRHKENLRYNTLGKTVLSLTREQADLLVNLEKLPITFLAPVYRREKSLSIFCYRLKKGWKRFIFNFLGLLFKKGRVLNIDELTSQEQLFMKAVNEYLGAGDGNTIAALMVSSRGPYPSISARPLLIRREHPLVRKAVDAVQADPRNVEIFMPLVHDTSVPGLCN